MTLNPRWTDRAPRELYASLRWWWRTGAFDPRGIDPDDLDAFDRDHIARARTTSLWIVALLTLFNLAFWLTDDAVFRRLPGVAETLASGRAALLVVAVAFGLLTLTSRSSPYPAAVAAGALTCFISARTLGALGGPSTPWFTFLNTFLLGPLLGSLRPPSRLLCVALLAAACVAGYFGGRAAYLRDPFAPTLLAHFAYVAALSVVVGWFADSLRLRFFLAQRSLLAERSQLVARVDEATLTLRRLVRHVDGAHDVERARLARELHDEIGQTTTALRYVLKTARARFERDASAIGPNLDQLSALLQQHTEETRRLLGDMRPRALDDLGLAPALDWLAARTTERGVPCEVLREGELPALPATAATAAFRCAQEALTNVVKHAQASRASVSVRVEEGSLELTVADDGRGLDGASAPGGGFGLLGMRERARSLGGDVTLEPRSPKGTTLRLRLPLGPEAGP